MGTVRLRPKAKVDLLNIGRHTEKQWGRAQRLRYLALLDQRFHELADDPMLGAPCEGLQRGLRRVRGGHHVIYFRCCSAKGRVHIGPVPALHAGEYVEIIRILHERMLPKKHLPP